MKTDLIIDTRFGEKHRHYATVTNNPFGQKFISDLKNNVSRVYKVRLRGRHSNRKKVLGSKWVANTQNDVPIKKSEKISIYLFAK